MYCFLSHSFKYYLVFTKSYKVLLRESSSLNYSKQVLLEYKKLLAILWKKFPRRNPERSHHRSALNHRMSTASINRQQQAGGFILPVSLPLFITKPTPFSMLSEYPSPGIRYTLSLIRPLTRKSRRKRFTIRQWGTLSRRLARRLLHPEPYDVEQYASSG